MNSMIIAIVVVELAISVLLPFALKGVTCVIGELIMMLILDFTYLLKMILEDKK